MILHCSLIDILIDFSNYIIQSFFFQFLDDPRLISKVSF
jgi:hypothetical protein